MTVSPRGFRAADVSASPSIAPARVTSGSTKKTALGVREDRSELWRIMRRFGLRRCLPAGALLFSPGDRARHLFFVESGLLDVFRPDEPEGLPVASFYPGACFTFDFGGFHVGSCEAREASNVIGLPLERLRELSLAETELRLLMRQSHAFELKTFLDACHSAPPARPEIHGIASSCGVPGSRAPDGKRNGQFLALR